MRIAGCVEYDGSEFCGWQLQPGQPSVQAAVESALSKVANHPVRVHSAGRTDTGVHALGQIVHFDTDSVRPENAWVMGTNSKLPDSVSLLWTRAVQSTFHARFSATSRSYRYVILNRRGRPGNLARQVAWHAGQLDTERMNSAAKALIGTHDFSAFRAARCSSKNPVKTVTALQVERYQAWVWIDVEASGYLHHMVRNIAGTLLAVGRGEKHIGWAAEVLAGKDRTRAGATATPEGLYFVAAVYPDRYGLPAPARPPKFW